MADPDASLETFVTYVTTHLTGDEKGEAADYLDHFFRALGHDGIKEASATRETRVAKKVGGKGKNLCHTPEEPCNNRLRDAQAKLDLAVRAAYAMPKDADILAFLLALNQSCAAKEDAGETITPPGLPLPVEEHGAFITEDCIKP